GQLQPKAASTRYLRWKSIVAEPSERCHMSFIASGAEILDDLVAFRRDLHMNPEIGLHLPRTQAKVLQALDGLGLEVAQGMETTSVVAVLRGAKAGPTVLLRGDMDALPVMELTGLEYAS